MQHSVIKYANMLKSFSIATECKEIMLFTQAGTFSLIHRWLEQLEVEINIAKSIDFFFYIWWNLTNLNFDQMDHFPFLGCSKESKKEWNHLLKNFIK